MNITITGSRDGQVIAQIIEDLLKVNGLLVKREVGSFNSNNLTIDQLDQYLDTLKREKVEIILNFTKEAKKPLSKKKTNSWKLDNMDQFIGEIQAAQHQHQAYVRPANPPVFGYGGGGGGGGGGVIYANQPLGNYNINPPELFPEPPQENED